MTDGLLQSVIAQLDIEYHQFAIGDPETPSELGPAERLAGLIVLDEAGTGALVFCGEHTGFVTVTGQLWAADPPLDLAEWEDAAQVVLPALPEGRLGIAGITAMLGSILLEVPPVPLLVRCAARGRDVALDPARAQEPRNEEYLVLVAPATPGDTSAVLKATSEASRYHGA